MIREYKQTFPINRLQKYEVLNETVFSFFTFVTSEFHTGWNDFVGSIKAYDY